MLVTMSLSMFPECSNTIYSTSYRDSVTVTGVLFCTRVLIMIREHSLVPRPTHGTRKRACMVTLGKFLYVLSQQNIV